MSIHINYTPPSDTIDYHQILTKSIVALVRYAQGLSGENLSVLDVGSGRGELLQALTKEGISVVGLDFDSHCVEQCRKIAPVVQADVNDLGVLFAKRSFDLVVAAHVLEHLENPSRVIQSISQITRRYLLVAVPNLAELANLKWRHSEPVLVNLGHKCGWDASHLKTFLLGCNFKVIRWKPDRVYLQRRIRPVFSALRLRRSLEDLLLPRMFPFQSHSLIVLAELAQAPDQPPP